MREDKRARRRRDLRRMKDRARRLYYWCDEPGKFANHLTTCSSWCCGNPRKWFNERTLQERRSDDVREDYDD